jgi:hypothetical protein
VKYQLKKHLTGKEALDILRVLVNRLDGISPDDMTQTEWLALRAAVENPPRFGGHAENKILNYSE